MDDGCLRCLRCLTSASSHEVALGQGEEVTISYLGAGDLCLPSLERQRRLQVPPAVFLGRRCLLGIFSKSQSSGKE